jgi:RNA polymerase sigma-70 factor (ECF subfamily)
MDADRTQAVIERARQGDMDAFMELFEEARPMVFNVACRVVGPDEAEDVVMDTYLKAWKAIPGFTGHSASRTWLCRIAHNCAIDHWRKQKPWTMTGSADEEPVDPSQLPDATQRLPSSLVAGAETAACIHAALDRLPSEHRATLLLRFADGLSYSEIAAATGVSLGTVMSRVFNGRRKLMKLLVALRGEIL